MAHYIYYNNKLSGADCTITPDSELAGAPAAYLADGKLFTQWRPDSGIASRYWRAVFAFDAAVSCDYFAIAAYDFVDDIDLLIEHSPDNSAWTTAETAAIDAAETRCIARPFTAVARQFWRLTIDSGSGNTIDPAAYLGVLYLGERLEIPRLSPPFTPPGLNQGYDFEANLSEGGLFIGGSAYYAPFDIQITLKHYTPAWIRQNVPLLMEAVKEAPFFIQWDSANRPEQVAYCWTTKEPNPPRYTDIKFMEWTLTARGIMNGTENPADY